MFVNLTPHAINIGDKTIPPSGQVARCTEITETVGYPYGVPLVRKKYGEIVGLPESVPGTYYIVSALVMTAVRRYDVVCPGNPVRDGEGKIVGCQALCCL